MEARKQWRSVTRGVLVRKGGRGAFTEGIIYVHPSCKSCLHLLVRREPSEIRSTSAADATGLYTILRGFGTDPRRFFWWKRTYTRIHPVTPCCNDRLLFVPLFKPGKLLSSGAQWELIAPAWTVPTKDAKEPRRSSAGRAGISRQKRMPWTPRTRASHPNTGSIPVLQVNF